MHETQYTMHRPQFTMRGAWCTVLTTILKKQVTDNFMKTVIIKFTHHVPNTIINARSDFFTDWCTNQNNSRCIVRNTPDNYYENSNNIDTIF